MNAVEFVSAIKSEVQEASVNDVISSLQSPPGRNPEKNLTELSHWFNSLAANEKEKVRRVAMLASYHATFGFLAVIDGIRPIEISGSERGLLELRYVGGDGVVLLNDPSAPLLHNLLSRSV